jgi:two-component sensor histidine kinase
MLDGLRRDQVQSRVANAWGGLEAAIPANSARAFAFATLCIAMATLVRLALEGSITLLFPTYYPAILLVSLICGFAISLFAIALSILAAWWFFMPPAFGLEWSSSQALNIGLFTLATTLIAWIGNSRRKLQEESRLLSRELQHRGKNQLMVVQAILHETLRRDEYTERALRRIGSLAIIDELLGRSRERKAPLHELAERVLQPFADKVSIQGPPLDLGSDQATATVLALHEFATNASKYGALSNSKGRMTLTWAIESDLRITWRETGGPVVSKPDQTGEGLDLIERLIQGVGGRVSTDFAPEGVTHKLYLPIKSRVRQCLTDAS